MAAVVYRAKVILMALWQADYYGDNSYSDPWMEKRKNQCAIEKLRVQAQTWSSFV